MSKQNKVLEILQTASHEGRNLGMNPEKAPQDKRTGWVTGLYLIINGCGTRYGARIHQLRHEHGLSIECHQEHHNGSVVPFYRLLTE